MKKFLSTTLLLLLSSTLWAQAENILGTWLTADQEAHVKISQVKGKYLGQIVWLKEANDPDTSQPWLDKENENEALQKLPLLRSIMLWGFEYENGEYINGNVYDSRDGKTYSGKLWLENENSLRMRGYVWLFYSTETWTRVK